MHDANIVFHANCRNIDLIVYGKRGAIYVQTKSTEKPAGKDCVIVDGSAWTEEQLFQGAPLFNKYGDFQAAYVLLVETLKDGEVHFYVAPTDELEEQARLRGREWYRKPKRDGTQRSINFRKELPREELSKYLNAWRYFGEPLVR